MAVIGKIREKSTLLLIMIGGALVLFILGDMLNSGGSIFQGQQNVVGEIAGETIDIQEFERRYQQSIENYKTNYQTQTIDENTKVMIRNQTWDQLVQEIILGRAHEELGVVVTSDELFDMIQGPNPHPQVVQAFSDPNTGQFNPQAVMQFLQNMEQDEETKKRWIAFEQDLKKQQKFEKYNTLIKQGLYVNSLEAKKDYVSKNRTADIRFVAKRYAAMPDSGITATDSEIRSFYDKHNYKPQYQQEQARDIKFVSFEVIPSQEDEEKVENWIQRITEEFKNTEDDTLFINMNSDNQFRGGWYLKGELSPRLDSVVFDAEIGTVVGPYKEDGAFKVAKVLARKTAPDSVKARHILIRTPDGNVEAARKTADSLKQVIKKQNNFAQLAMQVSEDFGSAEKGGELGWFREGMMVKPFNDAAFEGKEGDLPIVESQFGVHLIEIQEKSEKSEKVSVGIVERAIEPGQDTYQAYYAKANEFASEVSTVEEFENLATEQGLNIRLANELKPNDTQIPGLEYPREIIKWAYSAEEGDVSSVFDLGKNFVVATLVDAREEGTKPLEAVRPQIEAEVIQQKKAAKYIEQFNQALAGNPDIAGLADQVNAAVESATGVNFNTGSIPGMGREPKVIGKVMEMQAGAMSKPIEGNTGVYVVVVDNVKEAPELENYKPNKRQLASRRASRVDYQAFEALKEKAEIEDNRAKFY